MITAIEDYFTLGCGRCERFATADCAVKHWASGVQALRAICRAVGLTETVKWGHPCYMHAGRNIAIIGALRHDFRLSFFHAALLQDRDGLLEKQGPNTQHPDMLRFTEASQVTAREASIRAYLQEAMVYAEAGLKPPPTPNEIVLPQELTDALSADPELAAAFYGLTPGRQRSYVILLNGAKKSETRMARIDAARARILAGKGALER
jgi:uncharacterized protein YdeI (YjbR/CyaY-like superfamily)